MDESLPPEFQPLLDELAEAPENVRLMWRYAITLLMIDDEKARVVGMRQEEATEIITVQTVTGDKFEVVRPPMSEETERLLLEQLRSISSDDGQI